VIILSGVAASVLFVVLFRMANRGSLRDSARPTKVSKVPPKFTVNPAVVSNDVVIIGERAWTALDDHQLERLLKDSSP
jgi:hypothetical protein